MIQYDADGRLELTVEGASHFARLALDCMQREYPNKLNQVLQDEKGLRSPKSLHPAFYGCFDWHSSVHGHWMLVRLLQLFPSLPEAGEIRKKLSENLQAEHIAIEVAYFKNASPSWERMYGWAWLLKLAEELYIWEDEESQKWYMQLSPLAEAIVERYIQFLPIQKYPVRTGVHPNTAFGLSFALDFAQTTKQDSLRHLIEQRARDYYLENQNCPASWEPSGEDFLSACLEEAKLMSKVLANPRFQKWWADFLPSSALQALALPADVSDRSDPKIVHLDGLNLSRAWCFYAIANTTSNSQEKVQLIQMANAHLQASIPHIASTHYEGSHWLASFAVYALSARK